VAQLGAEEDDQGASASDSQPAETPPKQDSSAADDSAPDSSSDQTSMPANDDSSSDQTGKPTDDSPSSKQDASSPQGDADDNSESSPKPPSTSGSSGSAAPSTGNEYSIPGGEFFGIEAEGKTFVYVVDASGSMDGRPFQRAKQEIMRSIGSLTREQAYFVVFFGTEEFPMHHPDTTNALVPATPENVGRTKRWVDAFQTQGGTEPAAALQRALRLTPEVVYFLTDGGFDDDVVDMVRRSNTTNVCVNTVSFVNKGGEALLRRIANDNGGQFLFVP